MRFSDDSEFMEFVRVQRQHFKLIASHTRGDSTVDDVIQDCWVLRLTFLEKGRAIDLMQPADRELLMSHLYQRLVRYTDTTLRHAARPDHPTPFDEDDGDALWERMAGAAELEPLEELLASEAESSEAPSSHDSRAAALAALLRKCDNSVENLAEFLHISRPHLYVILDQARRLVTHQRSLLALAPASDDGRSLRPWRKFAATRRSRGIPKGHRSQLQFAF